MTIKQFIEAFVQGIKSMVSAIFMLILAWTFASVLSEGVLSTGSFVAGMVAGNIPGFILPVIIFLLSAFIAFTTGLYEEILVRGFAYNNFKRYFGYYYRYLLCFGLCPIQKYVDSGHHSCRH